MFPDAPTTRGKKHVEGMIKAVEEGYIGSIFFLVQMDDINIFTPNKKMDKDFYNSLLKASKSGVNIICYNSKVTQNSISIGEEVDVIL